MKAKSGYRRQKPQSPHVGNWLAWYTARRTCRKWKRMGNARYRFPMSTDDRNTLKLMAWFGLVWLSILVVLVVFR